MGFAFLDRWRPRRDAAARVLYGAGVDDPGSLGEMFSECGLLREHALAAGLQLDDSPGSLHSLDQLLPEWRGDPQSAEWLGNDAGHYLGTVIVRGVAGANWALLGDGRPVVVLADGREVDVLALGRGWAVEGSPELSAAYGHVDNAGRGD